MQVLPLLLPIAALLAVGCSAPAKEFAEVAYMGDVLHKLATTNLKDLGKELITKSYNFLMDKLDPASAEVLDCSHYASEALKSLTTSERKVAIEQATIEQNPLKDLGKVLLTTSYNFLMDRLGPTASAENWPCKTYALNALDSLTDEERMEAIQQAHHYAKTQRTQKEAYKNALEQVMSAFGTPQRVGNGEAANMEQLSTIFPQLLASFITNSK